MLQISEKCFAEDACLGLAYMLSIDDLSLADTCFNRLICSSLALQLAAYFYSLKGYKEIQDCTDLNMENQRNIYYIPPRKVLIKLTCTYRVVSTVEPHYITPRNTMSTITLFC